ncbi:MAG TPA: glycosyltransferase family 2 protein, partial [Nitrososphaeraceae archaeon]|nr:glycosyltransferase family 2 protein [Nitrososphaeraceae archaeon]
MEKVQFRKTLGDNNNDPKIIVCIPAYNEEKKIANIVRRARDHADEVIVCDDGSSDKTAELAKQEGALVIFHPKNSGYGKTVRSLFQTALERKADIIVTMDGDGQHDPEQIPDIIKPLLNGGFDIVIGSRFIDNKNQIKVPSYRSFGIKTITKLTKHASYKNITDAQSGFRGYSKYAIQVMNLIEDGMQISTEILFRAGSKKLTITEVPIRISYDVENTSTHNFLSHGIGVLFSVIQFISLRHPLIFYGLPGIALLTVSGYFAYNALELFSTTRFISINMILLSISATITGIILLTTGSILFTIAAMLRKGTELTLTLRVIQFISLRHPLIFYGLPGIALLTVSGYFAYN